MKDWKTIREQVGLLIANLQDHDQRRDKDTSEGTMQYCLNCLKNHMFPFTDSNLVQSTLNGMVEKFTIRNETEIGIALKDRVDKFLSSSYSFYRYDIVRLLFCLSNSPSMSTFASARLILHSQSKISVPQTDKTDFVLSVSEDEFLPSYSSSSSDESDSDDDQISKALDFVKYQKAVAEKMTNLSASMQLAEPLKPKEFAFAESIGLLDFKESKRTENLPLCIELNGADSWSILIHRIALSLSGIPSDLFARQGDSFSVVGFLPDFNVSACVFATVLRPICDIASESVVVDKFCSRFEADYGQQCLQSASIYMKKLQQRSKLELISHLQSQTKFNIFRLPQTVAKYLRHRKVFLSIINRFSAGESDRSVSKRCALFLSECYNLIETSFLENDHEQITPLAELFRTAFMPYVQCLQLLLEQGRLPGSNQDQFMIQCTADTSQIQTFQLRDDSSIPIFLRDIAQLVLQCVKSLHQLRLSKVLESKKNDLHLPSIFDLQFNQAVESATFRPFKVVIQESVLAPVLEKVNALNHTIVTEFISKNRLQYYLQQVQNVYFMLKGHLFVDFIHELSHQRSTQLMDVYRLSRLLRDQLYEYEIDESLKFALKFASPTSLPEIHFKFPFPLSLVFSEASLAQYNSVFSFLLEVSCAKATLESLIKCSIPNNQKHFLHVRWQIFHFTNTIHAYIRSQIAQLCGEELFIKLGSSCSLEGLLAVHEEFLDILHRDLFLKDSTKVVIAHIRNILSMSNRLKSLIDDSSATNEAVNTSLVKIATEFSSSNRFVMALLNRISLKSESLNQFGYVLMGLNLNRFYEAA